MLFERRNWRRVVLPVLWFVLGVWLYHVGTFVHALVYVGGAWSEGPRLVAMLAIATGLLLMPSALLHGVLRWRSAGSRRLSPLVRLSVYAPLALLVPVAVRVIDQPMESFLERAGPVALPYLVWLSLASLAAVREVLRFGWGRAERGIRVTSSIAAIAILVTTTLHIGLPLAVNFWPQLEGWLFLPTVLSPTAIVLVLGWAVMRYHVLRLVLGRSGLYGALVVFVILFDHTVLAKHRVMLSDRYGVDVALIEGVLLIGVVLAWTEARERVAEALRYLLGERVTDLRADSQRVAIAISAMTGASHPELAAAFSKETASAFSSAWCGVFVADQDSDRTPICVGGPLTLDQCRRLHRGLEDGGVIACRTEEAPTRQLEHLLRQHGAVAAVRITHPGVEGLVVLGQRSGFKDLSGEQMTTLVMLVEHLGVAVRNSELMRERLAADRRAHENQRLSMLGLVAGSIAHEVRNPLSSIKTIVSVLEEESAPSARDDLRLIRREIDRLSETVTSLLGFARRSTQGDPTSAREAIEGTLKLMGHLAKQHGVSLTAEIGEGLPPISTEGALREILFNLLKNGVEAAGHGGSVAFACRYAAPALRFEIDDTGPGIPHELSDRVFDPLVSAKATGTGLGLYVVGQRVAELGGVVAFSASRLGGTQFTVEIPVVERSS